MRIVAHFVSWPLYIRANLLNSAYVYRFRTTFEARLLEAVAQEPRALELSFSNWTAADLTAYMAKEMGIAIAPQHVGDHLKAIAGTPGGRCEQTNISSTMSLPR